MKQGQQQQRASSPKFVVTLDGAASAESLTEMDTLESVDRTLLAARNVVRVKPQTQPLTTLTQGNSPCIQYLLLHWLN